ncbi:hypothetical protein [Streptomyces sp. AC495_CC817]|uniref:hypothetical protein n=1 Tax=Streptomyces sp. AC495_CC817 TaxID=2823900 RepID=UPI001C25C4F0|nr:hypothetical protein [Streptomyces sp. AC495_CC817]
MLIPILVVSVTFTVSFLISSVVWAAVMICRVMRGVYGDLADLGGDDGAVRPEP